ncbi:MAG: hypothetical protein E6Q95_00805 [Chitinophagaceae bacterium]|nr:MAG: hypothetical protein E6Q95_00805 [Chitinophagaceae bacterium]
MKLLKQYKYFIPFALIIVVVDIILIYFHIINYLFPSKYEVLYDLHSNDSFAEKYQYIKWTLIIISLMVIQFRSRNVKYWVWIIIFFYFLLEDIFRVHEIIGSFLIEYFGLGKYYWGIPLGEILAIVSIGFVVSMLILSVYKYYDYPFRRFSRQMIWLICIFLFFAFLIDHLESLPKIKNHLKWKFIAETIEDGGELIAESLITINLCYKALKKRIV